MLRLPRFFAAPRMTIARVWDTNIPPRTDPLGLRSCEELYLWRAPICRGASRDGPPLRCHPRASRGARLLLREIPATAGMIITKGRHAREGGHPGWVPAFAGMTHSAPAGGAGRRDPLFRTTSIFLLTLMAQCASLYFGSRGRGRPGVGWVSGLVVGGLKYGRGSLTRESAGKCRDGSKDCFFASPTLAGGPTEAGKG
jgi:hypothetical protein